MALALNNPCYNASNVYGHEVVFVMYMNSKLAVAAIWLAAAGVMTSAENRTLGQTAADSQSMALTLPAGVQDAMKLSQSGVGEDVIIAKIRRDGVSYNLNSDQIIYLNKQGVPQHVIAALLQGGASPAVTSAPVAPVVPMPATPAPPIAPTQPAPEPVNPPPGAAPPPGAPAVTATFDSFHDQLSPYGVWIQSPAGWVWHPNCAPTWRPYLDGGHWVYTDAGWFWASDYPWGDIVFHYGRWSYDGAYGWIWTPAYDYAPAWVCWRHADDQGFVGWAPLPPGAVFVAGGWRFHGVSVAVGFDFGLGPTFFNFVAYDHFWDHDYRPCVVGHDRIDFIYHHSVFENHYRFEGGHFVNDGIAHDRIAHFTGRDVHPVAFHDLRMSEERDHFDQRARDRETVHGGGRVDAERTMDAARAADHGVGGRERDGRSGSRDDSHGRDDNHH